MIVNKLIHTIVIISLILVRGSSVYAVTTTPAALPTAMPTAILTPMPTVETLGKPILGVTCGNAYGVNGENKCCTSDIPNASLPFGFPLDTVTSLVMGGMQPLTNSFKAIAPTMTPCAVGDPIPPGDLSNPACICQMPTGGPLKGILKMCNNIKNADEIIDCKDCLQAGGVWTSLSCIQPSVRSLIAELFWRWGLGLAGGLSMLCIIYAAFMMQTSGGNAEAIKKAQQLLTSCITGLIIIIFSILILRIIGVNILRIPGFQ